MDKIFDEWCGTKTCSGCKYDILGSMNKCRMAFAQDMKILEAPNKMLNMERKLDAIIKHFEIKIGDSDDRY